MSSEENIQVVEYGKPRVVDNDGVIYSTDVAACPVTGNIIIVENKRQRIKLLDQQLNHVGYLNDKPIPRLYIYPETESSDADSETSTDGYFDMPRRVTVTRKGVILVSAYRGIWKFQYLEQESKYDEGRRTFDSVFREYYTYRPEGMATDEHGEMYICEAMLHQICVLDEDDKVLQRVSPEGLGLVPLSSYPCHIVVCGDDVFVSDVDGRLLQFTKSLTFIKQVDPGIVGFTRGLAVRGSQDLVIVNRDGPITIMRGGSVVGHVGECGSQPWQLNDPEGVAVTKTGQIVVANYGNANVLVFDPVK